MVLYNFFTFTLYFVALVSFRCNCLLAASDEDSAYVQYITPLSSGSTSGQNFPGKRAEKNLSDISGNPENVKKYDWELTWEMGAPNGNPRMMIFTNGQFPGPNLVVDEGDTIEVTLHNKLPFNTTIHWHGMAQLNTPWSDGVPGLGQKPIEPNSTFVYQFVASPYGTYWWHSHSRMTLMDGLYGVLHVRPKSGTPDPFHLISNNTNDVLAMRKAATNPNFVLMSDWNHLSSQDYFDAEVVSGLDIFCTDSVLINGKGSVYCKSQDYMFPLESPTLRLILDGHNLTDRGCLPNLASTQGNNTYNFTKEIPFHINEGCSPATGPEAGFNVDPSDGWASFNFINAASLKELEASIDEHPMWIYAVDGEYIEPQLTTNVWMYNGERYSAMIKLDKNPGAYTMRFPDTGGDQMISGYATMLYAGNNTLARDSLPYVDYAGNNVSAELGGTLDVTYLPPYPPSRPSPIVNTTHLLILGRLDEAWEWTLEGQSVYSPDRDSYAPLLFNPPSAAVSASEDLYLTTYNATWVDLILQVNLSDSAPVQPPHTIHKHSNKAYIIGAGLGAFLWPDADTAIRERPDLFDLETPRYRDTFVTSPVGQAWMVIRYEVVNPGPYLLHCHIETHLQSGMAVALLDGVDAWPTDIPAYYVERGGPNSPNGTTSK